MTNAPGRAGARLGHLARRFITSLRPPNPDPGDEAWLIGLLNDAERRLYEQMSLVDRVHAVLGAGHVRERAGSDTLAVAAALHDVGKTSARLGTLGRVAATLIGAARLPAPARIRAYLDHPAIGAELLAAAGSSDLTVAWAREHHQPDGLGWLPPSEVSLLTDADQRVR